MYWKSSGPSQTEPTVACALKRAQELGISNIVVASHTGYTASMLAGKIETLVCVTHAYGFPNPGENEMTEEMRKQLTEQGVNLLTATHVLSGAERGISRKFGGAYPVEIIAHTLRMFGQGVKVGVEIATMALDAGLIPYNQEVIAIGGSSKGADTAIVIKPAHAANIFDTTISEIICKP